MKGNQAMKGGAKPPGGGSAGASGAPASVIQYPLQKDTADVFRSANKSVLNPGLMFDRFAPDLNKAGNQKEEWKKRALNDAAVKPDGRVLSAYLARWQALTKAAGANPFQLKTDWRFIPGLGRKSALEIGFNFHRYGFPCLPGSAVKGIARTQALFELAESLPLSGEQGQTLNDLDKLLEKAQEDFEKEVKKTQWKRLNDQLQEAQDFRAIFGTLEAAGGAIFFEAIPQDAFALELDIMNPHYGPYYQGKEAPADWHNPVPVGFLAVPADKVFHFAVGWRAAAPRAEQLRPKAEEWLKKGLQELGAGAKTAAGYGYFK